MALTGGDLLRERRGFGRGSVLRPKKKTRLDEDPSPHRFGQNFYSNGGKVWREEPPFSMLSTLSFLHSFTTPDPVGRGVVEDPQISSSVLLNTSTLDMFSVLFSVYNPFILEPSELTIVTYLSGLSEGVVGRE